MRKAVIALHAAAVLVFTGLTAALWNDIEFCIAAMIAADAALFASLMLHFGTMLAAEYTNYDNIKLNRIADTASAEMLLLTVPLLLSPVLCGVVSKIALTLWDLFCLYLFLLLIKNTKNNL